MPAGGYVDSGRQSRIYQLKPRRYLRDTEPSPIDRRDRHRAATEAVAFRTRVTFFRTTPRQIGMGKGYGMTFAAIANSRPQSGLADTPHTRQALKRALNDQSHEDNRDGSMVDHSRDSWGPVEERLVWQV